MPCTSRDKKRTKQKIHRVMNHSRSTTLERSLKDYYGFLLNSFYSTVRFPGIFYCTFAGACLSVPPMTLIMQAGST